MILPRHHLISCLSLVAAALLCCPSGTEAQMVRVADEEVEQIETPHPYPTGDGPGRVVWTETLSWPEASFIAVHFKRFELAAGDVLVLSDPQGARRHTYTGRGYRDKGGDFWGLSIQGSAVVLTLISKNPDHESHGVTIDRWTHGYPERERDPGIDSVCGQNDIEDVECYKDTYPVEYDRARAVVRSLKNGADHCTAWLVSCENHLLTNEHCVATQEELDLVEFQFEYKRPGCATGTATAELQLHGGTLLEVDEPWDYALIIPELAGNDPQDTYGWLEVETGLPDVHELIYLAHHPSGDPKSLSIQSDSIHDPTGQCEVFGTGDLIGRGGTDGDVRYHCDTLGGSSGSPVISSETLKVVALHHGSGCSFINPDPTNAGVAIAKVFKHIQASDHPLPPCSWCDPGFPASGLSATADGVNRILLDWTAAADGQEYRVYRSRDGCAGAMNLLATSATSSYVDTLASGGLAYSYKVRAVNDCGRQAEPTLCEQASTTGGCVDAPEFAGLVSVSNQKGAGCSIRLEWVPGAESCGTSTLYNVYRSRNPGFLPDSSTLIASCLDASAWIDRDTSNALDYHYIVRAEDDSGNGTGPCRGGNEDPNLVEGSASVTGPDNLIASYDFESGSAGWTLDGEWEIAAPQGRGGAPDGALGEPDPTTAYQGSGVLGHDLSATGVYPGSYEQDIAECATSPVFDASGHTDVTLRFARWLNAKASGSGHPAPIEVFDGTNWQTVWLNHLETVATSWSLKEIDVSEHLAGVANAQVRFCQESDSNSVRAGWNVDALEIYSIGTCFSGQVHPVPDGRWVAGAKMTADRGAGAGEVDLSWGTASCPEDDYHLLSGNAMALPGYQYTAANCSIDSSGSDTVVIPDPLPGQFTWWVIIGAESARESVHGFTSTGAIRPASGSGFCGIGEQSSTTTCSSCGDSFADGAEICDGSDLVGETCSTQGFHSGPLGCAPDCGEFDTSSCAVCGDGIREADEGCDGDDFGGETCESLGYSGGFLKCDDECSEFFITLPCDE